MAGGRGHRWEDNLDLNTQNIQTWATSRDDNIITSIEREKQDLYGRGIELQGVSK